MNFYLLKGWGVLLLGFSLLMGYFSLMTLDSDSSLFIEWEFFFLGGSMFVVSCIFDWMSLSFLSTVSLISGSIMFYCLYYMANDKNGNRFILLLLLFIFSMMVLIVSPNLVSLMLGWDGLGLTSYCLVIYYQSENSESSGMLTILSNRLGDVGILIVIGLWSSYGSWNFDGWVMKDTLLISGMLMLSSLTKSAQVPFSSWLPAAMSAPTPVSSLVHSSTLVTAGVYLIIRFYEVLKDSGILFFIFMVSFFTLFMSSHGAANESDLKKIIAFSTLSQVSLMMMVVASGSPMVAFFHLVMHAMFKSSLFMCAGVLIHENSGCQDLRKLSGVLRSSPLLGLVMSSCLLSLSGFFFFSGFFSKDYLLEYVMSTSLSSGELVSRIILAMMCYLAGVTVGYSGRLIYLMSSVCCPSKSVCEGQHFSKEVIFSLSGVWLVSIIGGFVLSWAIFGGAGVCMLTYMQKYFIIGWVMIFMVSVLSFYCEWGINKKSGFSSSLINKLFLLLNTMKLSSFKMSGANLFSTKDIVHLWLYENSKFILVGDVLYKVKFNSAKPGTVNFLTKYRSLYLSVPLNLRRYYTLYHSVMVFSPFSVSWSSQLLKFCLSMGSWSYKVIDSGWSESYGGYKLSSSTMSLSSYSLKGQFVVLVFGYLVWCLFLLMLIFSI
uniref:NADH-ubiquinone oxidoreductase chain 5 n=1 Tax=Crangonyx forbesi TaxID=111557 RepID=A0A6C0X5M5_9CRUS|nr:NADH dehydrogenase subunit 5 [Crangonyx forbesi]